MPRDFFNQNRFGPPGPHGPMGMIRPGPPGPFGPRMGPPMFMRGPRPGLPGPPTQGEYTDFRIYELQSMGLVYSII